jgi:hypothetical protein
MLSCEYLSKFLLNTFIFHCVWEVSIWMMAWKGDYFCHSAKLQNIITLSISHLALKISALHYKYTDTIIPQVVDTFHLKAPLSWEWLLYIYHFTRSLTIWQRWVENWNIYHLKELIKGSQPFSFLLIADTRQLGIFAAKNLWFEDSRS